MSEIMSRCRSCGAPIYWIRTRSKNLMPCDEKLIPYKADRKGKDFVVTEEGDVIRCRLEFDGFPTGMARISHWATCPNAKEHRKPKRQEGSG